MEKTAYQIVDRIAPSDGWWKSDTEDALNDTALFMLEAGCAEEDVEDHLRRLVAALRGEYGE